MEDITQKPLNLVKSFLYWVQITIGILCFPVVLIATNFKSWVIQITGIQYQSAIEFDINVIAIGLILLVINIISKESKVSKNLNQISNIYGDSEVIVNYDMHQTDYSEIVTRIRLRTWKIKIDIIANSLTNIWPKCLKEELEYLTKRKKPSLILNILVHRNDNNNEALELIVKEIKEIAIKAKEINKNISISVFSYSEQQYFTGICISESYLKYRFRDIAGSDSEVIKTCGTKNQTENRIIQWYLNTFDDLKRKSKKLLIFPVIK